MQIICKIKNGRIENILEINEFFKNISNGEYLLKLEYVYENADSYRKYYFKCLEEISKHFGYSQQELHKTFKDVYTKNQTTKNMTKEEWISYIQNVREWCYKTNDIVI
jgi:AraC-like DNA-binding protein